MLQSKPMVSYAQNREDVVLDRALHASTGFYVDVGAASPTVASVTRHFYELGWSGINIEPLPEYVAELRLERPRDQTIQAVAGASPGQGVLQLVERDHDLSTMDPRRVDALATRGEGTTPLAVDVVTLDDVLDASQPATIDFLKIDVEGAERDVLLGIDLRRWRPRVLIVEATAPDTQIRNHAGWEDLVVERGYLYASFDGINRYYVPEEHASLIDLLGPASVLDEFVPASQQLIDEELERLRAQNDHVELEIALKDQELERLSAYIAHLETELARKEEHIGATAEYVRQLERDRHGPAAAAPPIG